MTCDHDWDKSAGGWGAECRRCHVGGLIVPTSDGDVIVPVDERMSAWAEIVFADSSDEWVAKCVRALAEIQTEQQRRDAAKIRKLKADVGPAAHTTEAVREILEWAAQDVDPEVSDGST